LTSVWETSKIGRVQRPGLSVWGFWTKQ